MRLVQFLKEQNISLTEVDRLCEYLKLNKVEINTKVDDSFLKLLLKATKSEGFKRWYKLKFPALTYEEIEIKNAEFLLSKLNEIEFDYLFCERIINSISFLVEKKKFHLEFEIKLINVLKEEKSKEEKFHNLKQLFNNKTELIDYEMIISKYNEKKDRDLSNNENFQWGGLNGDEAFDGYWNCD